MLQGGRNRRIFMSKVFSTSIGCGQVCLNGVIMFCPRQIEKEIVSWNCLIELTQNNLKIAWYLLTCKVAFDLPGFRFSLGETIIKIF